MYIFLFIKTIATSYSLVFISHHLDITNWYLMPVGQTIICSTELLYVKYVDI